jgi:hypothetical protein
VVYESMYGNTHVVAEAIGDGLQGSAEVAVVPVGDADRALLEGADLVVVGGPTHAHSMTRPTTRKAAIDDAHDHPDKHLTVDPDAEGDGVREWLAALGELGGRAAAFDTRIDGPPVLTGRASKGIAKRLREHGFALVTEPESFLVTKHSELEPGEAERARAWGAALAAASDLPISGDA